MWGDKVILVRNGKKRGWDYKRRVNIEEYLANGEIGVAAPASGAAKSKYLNVAFANRPDVRFGYRKWGGSSQDASLELAYALTVHKAQGSEFDTVFVVLPKRTRLMTRELLYTALTRARQHLVLLIEGTDAGFLYDLTRPERSVTCPVRKTCLALAIVLALPALLHAQEAGEPEKKEKRAQFIIHANYLPTLPNLDETTSFTRFLEQGSTSRVYSGGSGTAIEVGGMYALASRFSFGFSFELLPALQDGTLDVSEPHPLLFNQHLKASLTLDELDYSEFTVHTAFAYRIASERIEVELFAGPSVIDRQGCPEIGVPVRRDISNWR